MNRPESGSALIPALGWIPAYEKSWLKADVIAGLTTGAIVIPKAMAYASIAGLPLQVGLYTAFLPMVVYALLGTSRMLSVSTTTTHRHPGRRRARRPRGDAPGDECASPRRPPSPSSWARSCSSRALFRLGFVANFISDPVLTGFKAGIGFVIVVDQVPKLLGIHIHKEGFFRDVVSIVTHAPEASLATLAVAVATFVLIGLFEKFAPKAPTPLIAVAAGIAASAFLGLKAHGVSIVGNIPGGFPSLTMPDTVADRCRCGPRRPASPS